MKGIVIFTWKENSILVETTPEENVLPKRILYMCASCIALFSQPHLPARNRIPITLPITPGKRHIRVGTGLDPQEHIVFPGVTSGNLA